MGKSLPDQLNRNARLEGRPGPVERERGHGELFGQRYSSDIRAAPEHLRPGIQFASIVGDGRRRAVLGSTHPIRVGPGRACFAARAATGTDALSLATGIAEAFAATIAAADDARSSSCLITHAA
jgi:hypothetical protein